MLEASGLTDPGCVRENNEDCFLINRAAGLYLVADGMGGAQAGEKASRLASETVAEVVLGAGSRDGELLTAAFHEANRRVRSLAATDSSMEGMGTTLVAVLDGGDRIEIASVGDSRCYRFADGKLSPVTTDQTWVQEVGVKLGLDDDKLRSHPYRHVLTMAIGASSNLRINAYTLTLGPEEQILLCSDGLHGVVSDRIVAGVLNNEISLDAKCHLLVEAARKAGGPDNITVILLRQANHK
jgi:protein phosphatase